MAGFAYVASSLCLLVHVIALQHRDLQTDELSPTVPPPRLGASAPIDPQQAQITIAHLQQFIAASGSDGVASVVMMGDSTMGGVVHDFMSIYEGAEKHSLRLHTTNDRPEPVPFTNDHTKVKPGGEWYEPAALEEPMSKLVLERAQTAHSVLHGMNCTWAGGVTTFLFTAGPLKGLAVHEWGFIPEYGDSCWEPCYLEAVKAFKSSAVLWNIGLHLLNQKFDKYICERRQNMGKLNCGDHKDLVKRGTQQLLDAAPVVVYKTTNYLCDAKHHAFIDERVWDVFDQWQDTSLRPELEKECYEGCPLMKARNMTCFDWLVSGRSTELLYRQSQDAIDELKKEMPERASQIRVLDAFASAKTCCDSMCDATDDGEHYTGLDRGLVDDLAVMLSESV